jgi:type VI secretion system secreted protein Hcp
VYSWHPIFFSDSKASTANRKTRFTLLEYLKITMNDVLITKISPSADAGYALETVRLSFAKVKQEYIVQNAHGGSAGAVTTSIDIKANKLL